MISFYFVTELWITFKKLNKFLIPCVLSKGTKSISRSQIWFDRHATIDFISTVCFTLRMDKMGDVGTYLGIPLFQSPKNLLFQFILYKMSKKLNSWHKKNLSKADRMVMIKFVL